MNQTSHNNGMKPVKELGPISVQQFAAWIGRDLNFLEGLAAGMADKEAGTRLAGKVAGIRRNLKRLLMDYEPQTEEKEDERHCDE